MQNSFNPERKKQGFSPEKHKNWFLDELTTIGLSIPATVGIVILAEYLAIHTLGHTIDINGAVVGATSYAAIRGLRTKK